MCYLKGNPSYMPPVQKHVCNYKYKNSTLKFMVFKKLYIDILKCPTVFVLWDRRNVICDFFFPKKKIARERKSVIHIQTVTVSNY